MGDPWGVGRFRGGRGGQMGKKKIRKICPKIGKICLKKKDFLTENGLKRIGNCTEPF